MTPFVALLLSAGALVVVPVGLRRIEGRIGPRMVHRLGLPALILGVGLLELVLLLMATPVWANLFRLDVLAHVCERVLAHLGLLSPPAVGWAASVVALIPPVRAVWAWRSGRREMETARLLLEAARPVLFRGRRIFVFDSSDRLAMAIPGPRGGILVTRGLQNALHPCELDVVVAHEAAHLEGRDHRYLMALRALEVAFGLSRPVGRTIRYALERAADEAACGAERSRRRLAAEALCRAVGGKAAILPLLAPAATVVARVRALSRPAVVPSAWAVRGTVLGVGGMVAGGLGSVGAWIGHAHQALTLAICTL